MTENSLQLRMAAFCHTGLVRETNQDNLYFLGRYLEEKNNGSGKLLKGSRSTEKPVLLGVFDGMGGHVLGERAACIAAKETAGKVKTGLPENSGDLHKVLKQIVLESNEKVCMEMEKEMAKIGTTASLLCFYKDQLVSCNIGDSPIYLIRGETMEPLYTEHTERLFKEALYGAGQVKGRKFPLTQHIGIRKEEMVIEPSFADRKTEPGDRFLLCSDGLSDLVEEKEICRIVRETETASETVKKLARAALSAGGRDNMSIILIRAEKPV